MLKNFFFAGLIVLMASNPGWGLGKSRSIFEYRTENSKRTYLFFLQGKPLGQLGSVFEGLGRLEDARGYRFADNLSLDFTPLGTVYKIQMANKFLVNDKGGYLGNETELQVSGQSQTILLTHQDSRLKGYIDRGGVRQTIDTTLVSGIFAADNYMIDQYELLLAFKDLKIGDTVRDSIYIPQSLTTAPIRFIVEGFNAVTYGRNRDSAFTCHFLEPLDQTAYFTRDKKIVRLIQPTQNMEVLLSENALEKLKPTPKAMTMADLLKITPFYLLFLLAGALLTFPFWRRNFRKPELYISVILGALTYLLARLAHVPVQEWYTNTVVIPGIQTGGSLYLFAIFNALLTGLVLETFKIIPIAMIFFIWKKNSLSGLLLGIFCCVGFGIFESAAIIGATFQTGNMPIFSWGVFERIIGILFNVTVGAALGFGLSRNITALFRAWLGMILVHTLSSYLIVLVQRKVIDFAIFEILTALIYLLALLVVYLIIKKYSVQPKSHH